MCATPPSSCRVSAASALMTARRSQRRRRRNKSRRPSPRNCPPLSPCIVSVCTCYRRGHASSGLAMSKLSIIVPVLGEGENIAAMLDGLADLRSLGVEVIVVDGGSRDATVRRARLRADCVISAPRSRALQMNAGAARAGGDVLLFLHADTHLPHDADHVVLNGLQRSGRAWGRFEDRKSTRLNSS